MSTNSRCNDVQSALCPSGKEAKSEHMVLERYLALWTMFNISSRIGLPCAKFEHTVHRLYRSE